MSVFFGFSMFAANTSGASSTPSGVETPTDSGDHIHFTLAHTPLANTLLLYRSGVLETNYTAVGTAVTLGVALDTANGETLAASYSF